MQIYARSKNGIVVAPHGTAAEAGAEVLKAGGNAVEAMIAAAAAIAVVYPHMNGLGGDGFWLIAEPGRAPRAIEGCGQAAAAATIQRYNDRGFGAIPPRGPDAALTVPGAVAGWMLASAAAEAIGGGIPLTELLSPAVAAAKEGTPVSRSQAELTEAHFAQLSVAPGFAGLFLIDGKAPAGGSLLRQPQLADVLEHLAREGLDEFYRGDVGAILAADAAAAGSPLARADFAACQPGARKALQVRLKNATVFNTPPPTQGFASLLILGIYDRLKAARGESFEHVHGLVEATKIAFRLRDQLVTDPTRGGPEAAARRQDAIAAALEPKALQAAADGIGYGRAADWRMPGAAGDTIWMGAVDKEGVAVSYIQSVFWEFGSGVTSPRTGIVFQNRGASFSLDPRAVNALAPGLKPFHTLNPAIARLEDGRTVVYGSMGGDGQPQFQAQIYSRHVMNGMPLDEMIAAPRWLLGRTWGASSATLKLEHGFDSDVAAKLESVGHPVEYLPDTARDSFGHAGMIVRHPSGEIEGVHDPRADGGAAPG